MDRSTSFVHGLLAGAGLVIAGAASVIAIAWGARAARGVWRRPPDAPNYAYLR